MRYLHGENGSFFKILLMGIINECMLNEEKSRIPSQVGDLYHIPNDVEYYRQTYQNSARYNDYLGGQCYRTQVIEPSEKNSSVYWKMNNCSQPPSEIFNHIKTLKQESTAKHMYQPVKVRRTNHCQSHTVNKLKTPRRSGQPLSYQPMKNTEKDSREKLPNPVE